MHSFRVKTILLYYKYTSFYTLPWKDRVLTTTWDLGVFVVVCVRSSWTRLTLREYVRVSSEPRPWLDPLFLPTSPKGTPLSGVTTRSGVYWVRFSDPEGTSNPLCLGLGGEGTFSDFSFSTTLDRDHHRTPHPRRYPRRTRTSHVFSLYKGYDGWSLSRSIGFQSVVLSRDGFFRREVLFPWGCLPGSRSHFPCPCPSEPLIQWVRVLGRPPLVVSSDVCWVFYKQGNFVPGLKPIDWGSPQIAVQCYWGKSRVERERT